MGCDIHMHIEVKINGNWEHYAFPHISRRYRGLKKSPQDFPKSVTDVRMVFWFDN